MDIDVMAKHMPSLLAFKKRVEEMIDGAEAGNGSAAEALGKQISQLRAMLGETDTAIAALQVLRQQDERKLAEIFDYRLKDMADWFAENRAGLEVLLSIGDKIAKPATVDEPVEETVAEEAKPEDQPEPAAAAAEPEAEPAAHPAT